MEGPKYRIRGSTPEIQAFSAGKDVWRIWDFGSDPPTQLTVQFPLRPACSSVLA